MPRALRITLWTLVLLAVLAGATVLWVEAQLRPEPLGLRVGELLASTGLKGGVGRIEASLDGTFSAEGVDLTLPDGTRIKVASLKGEIGMMASVFGTCTIERFEAKGLELDLSRAKPTPKKKPAAEKAPHRTVLPVFALGPYAVSGRVILADGGLIRFSAQGDGFDSSGQADFRAGLGWPGFAVGTQQTDPRGEIVLKADFRRPLGAAGLGLAELARDIGHCQLHVTAKDASPVAAGTMELNLQGRPEGDGLTLSGDVRDSGQREAVRLKGSLTQGRLTLNATLDIDPTRFGILSRSLPDCRVTGTASAGLQGDAWQGSTDLKAAWTDLGRFASSLPRNSRSEWMLRSAAHGDGEGFTVEQVELSGHGVRISIPHAMTWKHQLLPEESPGNALIIQAQDADLTALTPFLALAGLVVTEGRWTGAAEISLVGGEPVVKSPRTHEFKGLTIAQLVPAAATGVTPSERILVRDLAVRLPLASANGVVSLGPLSVRSAGGDLLSGSFVFRPGKEGAWQAEATADVGIAELAGQPGWEELPVAKLRGIRINLAAALGAEAGKNPVVSRGEARILRDGGRLFSLRLRQPYAVGTRPTGVLLEANAADLPLESLAALVPGLKLTGNLNRADLVAGFRSEGLFVRTEGAPVAFAGTSVSWSGKTWVTEADLAASVDLLIGDRSTVLAFGKAEFRSKGRLLASGDLSLGLGEAPTTLRLTGDLAALAAQPFAEPLAAVTNGTYAATAQRSPAGDIEVSVEIKDMAIRNSAGRIRQARAGGKYSPTRDGLKASGQFGVTAVNLTEGDFSLTQTIRGAETDWQATVNIPVIDVDDLLALAPQNPEIPTPAGTGETTKPKAPDRAPFWQNQTGQLRLTIGKAVAYAVRAEKVSLAVVADAQSVRLTQLDGKLADGTIGGRGSLSFKPNISNGPYVLDADLTLTQFEIGAVAASFPAVRDYAQGRATAAVHIGSLAGTAPELAGRATAEATLSSKNGRLRAFGAKTSGTAIAANTAGSVGEIGGGLAILGGLLANNKQGEKIAKVGAAVTAAAKLQKVLSDFAYDTVDVRVTRLASGEIKLDQAEIRNSQLHIGARGGISVRPELPFADWPLAVDAQLRGGGEFTELFNVLGFAAGKKGADGLSDGPTVKVSGSLNEIKTDLREKLNDSVNKVKASLSSALGAEPAKTPASGESQTTPPAPKKKKGLLGELDKLLGQ